VAEDPEVVATNVGQLLEIGLVDTRAMQGIDELVRREGDLWRLSGSWGWGQQEGTEERKQCLMRMREGDRVAGRRLPDLPPWGYGSDGRERRRRIEVE